MSAKTIVGKLRQHVKGYLVEMVGDVGNEDVVTLADAIPVGAFDVMVTGRVKETITGEAGIASFDVGVDSAEGTVGDRFAAGKALVAGTRFGCEDQASEDEPAVYRSGADLIFTSNGGKDFTGGLLRVHVYYRIARAPRV